MIGMSSMALFANASRSEDWTVAVGFLVLCYLVVYPLYVFLVRLKHTRRIKNQLVTSLYKIPIGLTPAELSYVFSTRVARRQLLGTVLDLANRSVLMVHKKGTDLKVAVGPKIEGNLKPYEKLLYLHAHTASNEVSAERVVSGFTKYKPAGENEIRGSRQYVFWWLLRDDLRRRKLITQHTTATYLKMLFFFGVVGSLILSIVPLFALRLIQLAQSGKIDLSRLVEALQNGFILWVIVIPAVIVVSFFVLRFKGRMLGREWLMTGKLRHYLNQLDAYREFVRLTHRGSLKFESKELAKEASASTRPFAVAFGYIRE